MTDSLKFGPEWLRNLSSEGTTGGAPKYQLAEHRYGREEMLALFDSNARAPDPLVKLQSLYVEKTQTPMALLTMTEEETRQWHKGINSDAVLRLTGKTLVGPTGNAIRGRGGVSIDRGRGRSRGTGGYHYSRGLSYEEQSDNLKESCLSERSFSRSIRNYDRSQGVERNWSERNGGDPGDWNGSTSPRKEFSSMKDFSGGGRTNSENWRRHRGTDDEEGWRKSDKWGRSNSWRDEADSGEGGGLSKSTSRTSSWGRGWADEGLRGRSLDEDSHSIRRNNFVDEVPEWAMENPSESGGSFDASGAFHGGNYSEEEEENLGSKSSKNRLSESPPRLKKTNRSDFNEYSDECDEPNISPKDRKLSRSQTAQGNLMESSKISSHSLSKSQSSSNIKIELIESNPASSKRTESQNFDKIRIQHQNFIDKNSKKKELSEDSEVTNSHTKDAIELSARSEKVVKSETSAVLETISNPKEKSSVFSKEDINSLPLNTGLRLSEKEIEREISVNRQGSEEDMERMSEVVKDTVVKLFEDEEKPQVNIENDKWYYRDPQGVVQGPFRSSEMLEWFMNGYFQLSLLVRREQDEVYVKLGDLMYKCGKVPFLPGVNLPVLKSDTDLSHQSLPQGPAQAQPHGLSQSDIFMQQYQQYHILQKQFLLSQQLALNKLSQSDIWSTLSPVQQRSLLMQKLAIPQTPPIAVDPIAAVEKNPLSQLLAQMQQNKMSMLEVADTKNVDPIRQLLQQMSIMQAQPSLVPSINPSGMVLNHHLNPQTHLNSVLTNSGLNTAPTPLGVEETKIENPIQSLLRQLGNQSNLVPPAAPTLNPADSLWGAPGRAQHWTQPSQPVNSTGCLPIWEIKTEQQILAEQQLLLDEERRQEELRKRKEEEEAAKKQKELEEKRKEGEKKEEKKKQELKRLEEEKIRIQKEKEKEEKKKAEEIKRKQQQEEALKKKQEMAKKLHEAQKKKEEKERKKEEEREKRRLLEEGKKKLEIEKKKKEEEQQQQQQQQQQRLKKKQEEEEEAAKKQEQLRRPIDVLKKLQDQQMEPFKKPLPWSQPQVTASGTSLSDIQKMQEKEKKQLLREQQAAQHQAQQKELQQQKENESRSNGLNLKWAEQLPKTTSVKSLAEIQAEEQHQLAKVDIEFELHKQLEKERLERAQQQREAALTSNTGIWGNASQSLTWTNNTAPWGVSSLQNISTPGFWDEVAPNATKNKSKTPLSPLKGKTQTAPNQKQGNSSSNNQKNPKPKSKKEEAAVMKLFERFDDDFTSWCSASLQSIQSDVDIPTFVSFLRDIESPYEVTEYVKCYLGDGKEAQEFAKQFLERRSRWMSAHRANVSDEDRNALSHSVNTGSQYQSNVPQDFQEVKGKGKKSKKGKMLKVDNRILGFSVTAAPDRINVGDRDYVTHNL